MGRRHRLPKFFAFFKIRRHDRTAPECSFGRNDCFWNTDLHCHRYKARNHAMYRTKTHRRHRNRAWSVQVKYITASLSDLLQTIRVDWLLLFLMSCIDMHRQIQIGRQTDRGAICRPRPCDIPLSAAPRREWPRDAADRPGDLAESRALLSSPTARADALKNTKCVHGLS